MIPRGCLICPVVEATDLYQAYGSAVAVNSISFEDGEGEVFDIVRPNGACKTTTFACLEEFRHLNSGTVRMLGHNPWRATSARLRERRATSGECTSRPTSGG